MPPRSAAAEATPRPMPEVPPMTRTRAFFRLMHPLSAGRWPESKTLLVAEQYPSGMVAPDLDMRKLRYFVAVAEELNFGRAAERLHIAQPVLSRQIPSFQSELGVQLSARDSRGTQLTTAGKQLLEDARFLLAESKALQQRLFSVAEPTVTGTVGVMPDLLATAAAAAFEADDPSRRAVVKQLGWAEQVDVVH